MGSQVRTEQVIASEAEDSFAPAVEIQLAQQSSWVSSSICLLRGSLEEDLELCPGSDLFSPRHSLCAVLLALRKFREVWEGS